MLEVTDESKGICNIIHRAVVSCIITYSEALALNKEMHSFLHYKRWHSGIRIFPIDHPRIYADTAYDRIPLWDENTEYGSRRLATLKHLNKYLEELRNA